jgi:hypothetical protein
MTLDGAFARCIFLAALAAGVDSRSCAKLLAFAAMRRLFIRYDGTFSSCGRCVLVAASIDRPAAAAGRHVRRAQCVVARVPGSFATRRDRRIAPRLGNWLTYRTPEGRYLPWGEPDPAIDFGATKIDGARLLCPSVLEK